MKKIYVAGDYSADNIIEGLQNIGKGRMESVKLFRRGFAPFCPWWDASFCIDLPYADFDKDMFYNASMAWMEASDAVYVISGVGKGGGVDKEIARAAKLGIPVFYNMDDLVNWSVEKVTTINFMGEKYPLKKE